MARHKWRVQIEKSPGYQDKNEMGTAEQLSRGKEVWYKHLQMRQDRC